jgi:7,8-dihydropterin-6-yl-methyl-4-(beta-D-ribofuranosyl)aminobenzene 5'-phosphate synthase
MKKALVIGAAVVVGVPAVLLAEGLTVLCVRFARARAVSDEAWRHDCPVRLAGLGAVERLRVLPLVEASAVAPAAERGIGVSYLVSAGESTILFDVGGNPAGENPAPVVANAASLGVDLGALRSIVISHLHPDHVGDLGLLLDSPGLAERLSRVDVYLPAARQRMRSNYHVLDGPAVLAPGVASIGPIASTYWGMGTVVEQALAVNLAGKGIVLVVGCGHQGLGRILERAEALFDAPIYGIVGGLHLPATGFPGAHGVVGLGMRLGATGEQPWHGPLGKRQVREACARIAAYRPGVVGLSPHDSCAWAVSEFRRTFGEAYRDVQAGREIVVQ